MAQDIDRYNWLSRNKLFSVSIEKNFHKGSYISTKDEILDMMVAGGVALSSEAAQKMIDTDTVWSVQVYPDNPIGFSIYYSHDLAVAIDKAIADYPL